MALIDFDPKTTAELDSMRQTMHMVEKLGATVTAAELNAKNREEDQNTNNAQVLKYLAHGNTRAKKLKKRDFVSMGSDNAATRAEKYTEEVNRVMQKQADRNANALKKGKKTKAQIEKSASRDANKAAADGLIAAMEEVKRIIAERIDNGVDWEGAQIEDLEDDYKKQKERDHHHVYPIGNATGQVIDNLAPGKRNIRLRRK